MSLDIRNKDVITFGDCKVDADAVFNPAKKFKLCIRFDGAVELVEADGDYWFTDWKFHWHLKQKFNVLICDSGDQSPESSDYENYRSCNLDENVAFFVGNRSLLRKGEKKDREYQFVECDYIDGKDKPPRKSTDKLELVVDKRLNVRIGYVLREENLDKHFSIQSYNPIDVHVHCDEGYYHQAVLFDKVNKNRLVMLGHQNGTAGPEGIPEMIYIDNYDRKVDKDEHDKEYVREFIKSNVINCEEAIDFYIPNNPTIYTCKSCTKIAQEVIDGQGIECKV